MLVAALSAVIDVAEVAVVGIRSVPGLASLVVARDDLLLYSNADQEFVFGLVAASRDANGAAEDDIVRTHTAADVSCPGAEHKFRTM